jgi:hypothetical protein
MAPSSSLRSRVGAVTDLQITEHSFVFVMRADPEPKITVWNRNGECMMATGKTARQKGQRF